MEEEDDDDGEEECGGTITRHFDFCGNGGWSYQEI